MVEPILLIMAAGMGSRYGGAKQIDPVTDDGDTLMDLSLYDAHMAGFKRLCCVVNDDVEHALREHMEGRADRLFEIQYSHQWLEDIPEWYVVPDGRTKPWGTAHAVYAARRKLDAPFAVLNADDYYGRESFVELYEFLKDKADNTHHAMVGFKLRNTLSENGKVSRGICKTENGLLTDIEETFEVGYDGDHISGVNAAGESRTIDDDASVSMNMFGFGYGFLDAIRSSFEVEIARIIRNNPLKGEFYLPIVIDDEIKSGSSTFEVLESNEKWYGVTYKEDKPYVVEKFREMKAAGKYPADLWK